MKLSQVKLETPHVTNQHTWVLRIDGNVHAACASEKAALAALHLMTGLRCPGCPVEKDGQHKLSCNYRGKDQLTIPVTIR